MSEQVSCTHPPNMCEAQYPLAALASHHILPASSCLYSVLFSERTMGGR